MREQERERVNETETETEYVCVCVCMHVCVCVCACVVCVCSHIHARMCISACPHACVCMRVYGWFCACQLMGRYCAKHGLQWMKGIQCLVQFPTAAATSFSCSHASSTGLPY